MKIPGTAIEKTSLRELHGRQKLRYIWDYYKLPIVIALIFLYIIGYNIYRQATYKETVLSAAFVNVSASDELASRLTDDFLTDTGLSDGKHRFYRYENLYLTDNTDSENHQYVYASRMKILGAIDSEAMDLVFMDKEAFDAFSQNGYLCDIEALLLEQEPDLYEALFDSIQTNTYILEDNADEVLLDPSVEYQAETAEYPMGIALTDCPIIQAAGFSDTIYLGIIANSPHKETAVSYLKYLYH